MTIQKTCHTFQPYALLLLLLIFPTGLRAQGFYDDFTDGGAQDGAPVTWVERAGTAYVDENANLVLEYDPSRKWASVTAEGTVYFDSSVRTQVRMVEGDSVWIASRYAPSGTFSAICYSAGLHRDGLLVIGTCGSSSFLTGRNTELDVTQEDVILQFDVIGSRLSLWAWRPGESMPEDPLLWVVDDALEFGLPTLAVLGDPATAEFRFVQVDTTSIRIPGDFNRNSVLDVEDINLLTTASAQTPDELTYDLNDDQIVNSADVRYWAKDLRKTWIGDANVDGEFNTKDFVDVLTPGKYETGQFAVWSEGDWNGDGVFATGDLVIALEDGGYELGRSAEAAAVPEPTSAVMLLAALGLAIVRMRRVSR